MFTVAVAWRCHYKNQNSHYHSTTPPRIPDDTSTTITPSAPVDIQIHPPVVHYVPQSPTNSYTFVPPQSGDYPSQPPPKYIPEPPPPYPETPPPDYTPN